MNQRMWIPALLAALTGMADGTADTTRVYFGTYTGGASEGIYVADLDVETGALLNARVAAATENPSFLALHPTLPVLYAVGEMVKEPDGPGGTVSAFEIDKTTGTLTLINRQSSVGAGPCHIAIAPSGNHAAVANYGGGSLTVLPLDASGALGEASAFFQHEGSSVNAKRQEKAHTHSVTFDAAGNWIVAADLGMDKLMVYDYAADGAVAPHDPPFVAATPGSGPRHTKFHPNGRFFYAVNELANTVTAYAFNADQGTFEAIQTIGTLPLDFDGENTTAEIRVHPSGRFLYASNRGHDSIAAFSINADGNLALIGNTPTGGKTPRNFNLDPTGTFLLAANQNSDSVVVFRISGETGLPEPANHTLSIPSPVCVLFMD